MVTKTPDPDDPSKREFDSLSGDERKDFMKELRQRALDNELNLPGTLVRNCIVSCIQWLEQLNDRERVAVMAFLKAWYS